MSQTREYAGKTVAITGAGSGIGRATALAFARAGAALFLCDVDSAAIETVGEEARALGVQVSTQIVDVAKPEDVEGFAEHVFSGGGRLDVLHNNAGIGHAGRVEDTPLEDWQKIINVNLMGVIHGVHYFVPKMLAQGGPSHIVNTASMAGLVAATEMAPYSTSKFAVVGLSEALEAELAPRGIHVTALCPGIIDTAIVDTAIMRGSIAGASSKIQKLYHTRGTSPDVVADAVLAAVRKRKIIQPTPLHQVSPAWWLKRVSPRASKVMAQLVVRSMKR